MIDSPEAYDEAAHAALSFALDDSDEDLEGRWQGLGDHLDYSDSGYFIRRQKEYLDGREHQGGE